MLDLCSTSESRACGSARELNGSSLQPMSLPPLGTTPSTARVESRLLRLEPQAQVLLDVAWKAWRGPDPRCGRSVASGVSSESTRRIFVMHCSVRPSSTSRLLLAMKMAECIAYVPKIAIHFQVQSWALEPHCTDCPTLVHVATGAAEGVFLICIGDIVANASCLFPLARIRQIRLFLHGTLRTLLRILGCKRTRS